MKCGIQFIMAILISSTLASDAKSERVWEGHIHLVNCRLQLHFAGYEYGDLNDLRSIEIKTGRGGGLHEARFIIVPDDDDPLRATFSGRIRVVVDGKSAETRKLRLVRRSKFSETWKIHPDDIRRLAESSNEFVQE